MSGSSMFSRYLAAKLPKIWCLEQLNLQRKVQHIFTGQIQELGGAQRLRKVHHWEVHNTELSLLLPGVSAVVFQIWEVD